jgi:alpha-galactosidase
VTAFCEVLEGAGSSWRLANPAGEIILRAGTRGLEPRSMKDPAGGAAWTFAEGSAWPWLKLGAPDSGDAEWRFVGCAWEKQDGGLCLRASFHLGGDTATILVECVWMADELPVWRRWSELTNPGGPGSQPVRVESCLVLDLALQEDLARDALELFYVDAFAGHRKDNWEPGDMNFATHSARPGAGGALRLEMGAYQPQCSWLALRRRSSAGIFMGLEYGGGVDLRAYDIQRTTLGSSWATRAPLGAGMRLAAIPTAKINAVIEPGETWHSPAAFWGLFRGDWDAAANLTHAFVEAHLAPPWPGEHFPFVELNTWAYAFDLTPAQAWRCLETAAQIGAEVFDADYGWMERVGDWQAVERNFPPLRAMSDRAHALGLKFGLWMSFANAHPDSAVAQEHPDWLAWPDAWGSFSTRALCVANPPTREWVCGQAIRVNREYGVDYFKFDFEVISPCTHPDHNHPPDPGGYHSLQGFNAILARLRREFPGLVIESCAGGGRLMSYDMVRLADTSITSDGGVLRDALARRAALYGASYPFPLRYCDNYMEEAPSDLACHASMIGGPWIIMDRAAEWTPEQTACARRSIALYKRIRPLFREGSVYHLRPPDGCHADALQVQSSLGRGVVYLFQPPLAEAGELNIALRGLDPQRRYRLRSSRSPDASESFSGQSLMEGGLTRELAAGESEIIEIELEIS